MSKIDNYNKFNERARWALSWASLIGDRYRGGGGGIGKLHSLKIEAVVYHQYSNGAKNYHDAPELMQQKLAEVIIEQFPMLLQLAKDRIEAERQNLAEQALQEHRKLIAEAGLEVPT